jgi:hypothetical protein
MEYAAEGHVYSDAGKVIPSVTQILNPTAAKPWFSHGAAERGTLAHERCAEWALKPSAFPYEAYVDSFAMWTFSRQPEWIKVESIIDGSIDGLRYAGRLDGLAMIEGVTVLIDYKTGVKAKYHHAQIGAYALVEKPARGLVLYLHDDMSYTEDWLTAAQMLDGIAEFRAALRSYYALRQA